VSCAWRAGKGGFVQDEQLLHWNAYVAWEASNVQRLDQPALAAHVVLAYEQVGALGCAESLGCLSTTWRIMAWQTSLHRCSTRAFCCFAGM
jgi:hypothetical protein